MRDLHLHSALLCTVVAACYYYAPFCGFVFDDMSAVRDNKDLRPETPLINLFLNDFWGTPMHQERSHKSYRPLCVLTFRWNYAFGELNPAGYHAVNVILHAAVSIAFYWLCRNIIIPSSPSWTSLIAALLFSVHPVHTEAVTGVVGRAELLSSLFFILALISFAHSCRTSTYCGIITAILCVVVAMLCKEQGITVIAVCCVYDIFIARKMIIPDLLRILTHSKPPTWFGISILRMGILVGTSAFLMIVRWRVMGGQLPVFTRFDNPAAAAESPWKQLTYLYMLPLNAWLLLCPLWLCCDWTMGTIPLLESLTDIGTIHILIFAAGFIALCLYATGCCTFGSGKASGKTQRAVLMSLSLIVFPFIPASNLLFPVGFVVAERILYAPSMGFCLLVAIGFEHLHRCLFLSLWRKILWVAMAVLILLHSAKTIIRNYDWESEYSIFSAGVRVNRANAKLFNNVGHALEGQNRHSEALVYFQHAAFVQPDDIGAHINVGRANKVLERFDAAEKAYRTALALLPPVKAGQSYTARVAPSHLNVFLNLANLLSRDGAQLEEADRLLRTAISMRSDFTEAYINRGDILLKMNKTIEAQQQYEKALTYDPTNPDLHYNLGVVHLEQRRHREALESFNRALTFDPRHKQTLFNSAVLMQDIGNPSLRPEAIQRLKSLMQLEPNNEKVYFNLAMLATDERDFQAARSYFDQAILLQPDFRSALFNAALMVSNDLNQPLEAIPYLEQLLKFHPRHSKGLILMGDVYINHIRDLDKAEQCFSTILETEPNNVQAAHNLCVVYVERGELQRAEKCLVDVLVLAPHEEYVRNHLSIVRQRLAQVQNNKQQQQQLQQKMQTQTESGTQRNGNVNQDPSKATKKKNKQKKSQASDKAT